MDHFWDNPVRRHAGRLIAARSRGIAGLVLGMAVVVGLLLQRYWMEVDWRQLRRPGYAGRLVTMSLLAEVGLLGAWAASRGGQLGRRVRREGHLDDYRRSRLAPVRIAVGLWGATIGPPAGLLAGSALLAMAVGSGAEGLSPVAVLLAHAVVGMLMLFFGLLGLLVGDRTRSPTAPIGVCLAVLVPAIGAIALLDPLLGRLDHPQVWIYATLLPNPVPAVAGALGMDVLRVAWLYEHLHAHEYFYVSPLPWQTAAVYLGPTALLFLGLTRRIGRPE